MKVIGCINEPNCKFSYQFRNLVTSWENVEIGLTSIHKKIVLYKYVNSMCIFARKIFGMFVIKPKKLLILLSNIKETIRLTVAVDNILCEHLHYDY